MRKSLTVLFCLVLSLAVVASFSCRKASESVAKKFAEKAIEHASGGKTKVDLGALGNVDISGLPEALRYPGAKAITKFSMSGEEGKGTSYVFETADPAANVTAFFKRGLAGWKSSMTMESENGVVMGYSTADEKQSAVITIGYGRQEEQDGNQHHLLHQAVRTPHFSTARSAPAGCSFHDRALNTKTQRHEGNRNLRNRNPTTKNTRRIRTEIHHDGTTTRPLDHSATTFLLTAP